MGIFDAGLPVFVTLPSFLVGGGLAAWGIRTLLSGTRRVGLALVVIGVLVSLIAIVSRDS